VMSLSHDQSHVRAEYVGDKNHDVVPPATAWSFVTQNEGDT